MFEGAEFKFATFSKVQNYFQDIPNTPYNHMRMFRSLNVATLQLHTNANKINFRTVKQFLSIMSKNEWVTRKRVIEDRVTNMGLLGYGLEKMGDRVDEMGFWDVYFSITMAQKKQKINDHITIIKTSKNLTFQIQYFYKPMRIAYYYLSLILSLSLIGSMSAQLDPNSVYSIPYLRTFRPDLVQKSIGCGHNIAYSSYTHPEGLRDAAHIVTNQYQFGVIRCQAREMYLKIFGYAQNYEQLTDAVEVANAVKRSVNGKFKSIIVDWKGGLAGNLQVHGDFLNSFLRELGDTGIEVYLKVPASYLCKNHQGKPFILSIPSAKRIIIQTYGESSSAYKNKNQLFFSQTSQTPASEQYPQGNCPKFPSLVQLRNRYPNLQFFIEKTLHQEEPGYLGELFRGILEEGKEFYGRKVFYDGYPPSIIRL